MTDDAPTTAAAFYLPRADGSFDSTSATTSPWDPSAQHGGPPSALLARAIELLQPRSDMAISRISIDFLGGIPQGQMLIDVEMLRPGKRIELVEARLTVDGRLVAIGRAWRSQIGDSVAPARPRQPDMPYAVPEPHAQDYFDDVDPEWGYGRAIEWRFLRGGFRVGGPAQVWARPLIPLVAGEQPSGLQRALIVADSANGLSAELNLREWLFIPPALAVTVFREPASDWLMLDARTMIDPRGMGIAHATLFDETGEFGVATHPLLVQRRSGT